MFCLWKYYKTKLSKVGYFSKIAEIISRPKHKISYHITWDRYISLPMTWTLNFRRCFSVFDRMSTRALSDASKLDINLIISFLSQDSKSLISCWLRSKRYSELVISFQYLVNSSCNVTSAWLFCLIRVVMTSLNSSSVRFFMFRYCEKATKFEKNISPFLLNYLKVS